jgi:hypothetical protein
MTTATAIRVKAQRRKFLDVVKEKTENVSWMDAFNTVLGTGATLGCAFYTIMLISVGGFWGWSFGIIYGILTVFAAGWTAWSATRIFQG